jgi:dihydrodipicolinate synthase/N-acetylneuraminate lyase
VALFEYATAGRRQEAWDLYRWFLPLLRMGAVPRFVQLIKLVQEMTGMGSARVRPPRLELSGGELRLARQAIQQALDHRSKLTVTAGVR